MSVDDGSVIRLLGAGRTFGSLRALRPLDLTVGRGRCVGVVGHNGSGKSTLLQLIAGRLRPTSGSIEVCGTPLSTPQGRRAARRSVSLGGTTVAFYPDLTVREHLIVVAQAHEVPDVDIRVRELLERSELSDRQDALPGQLSTGMRQKLDLALALIRPFEVLLLDEPDRGLDPAARRRIWEDIAAVRDEGRTVLVAAHQLSGLEAVFDEVLLLEHGGVLERGPLGQVRGSPAGARLGLSG